MVDLAEEGVKEHPGPSGSENLAGRRLSALTVPALFAGAGRAGPAASSDRLADDWQQEQPLGWGALAAPFCLP